MSLLIQYLVKLSISLAVVWLFYQFILRRLTFYNSNRWYLLAYTMLSFFIPFVNISSLIENRSSDIIQFVPSVHQYTNVLEEASHCPVPLWSTQYDKWDFIGFGLMIVAVVLLLRFVLRYLSFLKIQRNATLISEDGVKIYQVDDNIIPFSFGNSIFINSNLHTEAELEEIVRHEFVHVRQRHTLDIIWAEMLCIINWYNPFAWLLKRSIRQNLEFIADNKVIGNGINKKQYQYLLLKVIGNNQFSIATQFNFSSLKKRIVMMNKTKSAKRQVGRFLFLVPVLAIILLSFRKSLSEATGPNVKAGSVIVNDTVPGKLSLNKKGYHVNIVDDNGDCTVVVKDKNNKEVKRMLLVDWNARSDYYENLYGEIATAVVEVEKAMKEKNPDIRSVTVKGDVATITLNNGKQEVYTLSLNSDRKAFEERCGTREVAIASVIDTDLTLTTTEKEITDVNIVRETIADHFEITDNKAKMYMKNGKLEEYNLADPKERKVFEQRFGKIITPSLAPTKNVTAVFAPADIGEPSLSTTVTLAPSKEVAVIGDEGDISTVEDGLAITLEPEILLTITNKTTADELTSFKKTLKDRGFEFSFDETEYKNGTLVKIRGSLKSKDGQTNFVGVDFQKLIVSQVKHGEKVYFRVDEVVKKKSVS